MRILCCTLLGCLAAVGSADADDFKLEPGFKPFFNGKDLTGFNLRKGGTSLDGKTATEKNRFQVAGGKLIIDGKSRGNVIIDTKHSFKKSAHIKFEFMAQKGCNNDLYILGLKFDIKQGGVKNLKYGKWQTFEIVATDGKVDFQCDGETQRTQKAKTESSPLGIRAEFGAIQFRRMRYREK